MPNPRAQSEKDPPIQVGWKGAKVFIESRDSLRYRSFAVVWHVNLLDMVISQQSRRIEKASFDSEDEFQTRYQAIQEVGFVFDDLIFNAMSAFDYVANLILHAHSPKHTGRRLWNDMRKRSHLISDAELQKAISSAEKNWVSALAKYRGSVIHRAAEPGDHSYTMHLGENEVRFDHAFILPQKAIDVLPIFANRPNLEIMTGAIEIATQTLSHIHRILMLLSQYKYDPRTTSTLDNNKFSP